MPDHMHWIFKLGVRLTVSQVIAKWKTETKDTLELNGMARQKNFFEHRVRPDEELESYVFYIFMNPYVADLISLDDAWPGWRKSARASFRFEAHLRDGGAPQPEWMKNPLARGAGLAVDL